MAAAGAALIALPVRDLPLPLHRHRGGGARALLGLPLVGRRPARAVHASLSEAAHDLGPAHARGPLVACDGPVPVLGAAGDQRLLCRRLAVPGPNGGAAAVGPAPPGVATLPQTRDPARAQRRVRQTPYLHAAGAP